MYHSVITKLSCFSSPLCHCVAYIFSHHHTDTHKKGYENEQEWVKTLREPWPAAAAQLGAIFLSVFAPRDMREIILTACALQSLPEPKMCGCLCRFSGKHGIYKAPNHSPVCTCGPWYIRDPLRSARQSRLPEVVEGISDMTVTRSAFHHSTIPPLARASKLIPLTPTLYDVTRQTIPAAANEECSNRA